MSTLANFWSLPLTSREIDEVQYSIIRDTMENRETPGASEV